eukprot:5237535-Prymnesium_polylepis.1
MKKARVLLHQKSERLRRVGEFAQSQQAANEEAQAQLRAQQATERFRLEALVQRRLKSMRRGSIERALLGRSQRSSVEARSADPNAPPPYDAESAAGTSPTESP